MSITLCLKHDKENLLFFSPLMQTGFWVKAKIRKSIKNLLCDQFKVNVDYLMKRINTIFLDGKPVDDVETSLVNDGSTLALAAAMPGLVGATMRRGGYYAAFRSTITHQGQETAVDRPEEGMVKIKLFNQIIPELGPHLLKIGIWLKKEDAERIMNDRIESLQSSIVYAEKDGQEIDKDHLATLKGFQESENVFLKVIRST